MANLGLLIWKMKLCVKVLFFFFYLRVWCARNFLNETTKYRRYVTNDGLKISVKRCLDAKLKIIRTREVFFFFFLRLLVLPTERNSFGKTRLASLSSFIDNQQDSLVVLIINGLLYPCHSG